MLELVIEGYNCCLTIQSEGKHEIEIDKIACVAHVTG